MYPWVPVPIQVPIPVPYQFKCELYPTLHASIAEITAQLLSLSYVYLISSDDGSIIRIFVQINILEGRAFYVVLMGRVSITISYSFCCLTTETVKYINENGFIENLAESKYMWAQRGKQM